MVGLGSRRFMCVYMYGCLHNRVGNRVGHEIVVTLLMPVRLQLVGADH